MTGRIPQAFIDELIARADIVEIVGTRVALKKAGANYKGLCPFHGEKTPSFTVSPAKGFYHCFGCSAHGTAIGFLMNYENMPFPDAVAALAERLGVEMPRTAVASERPAQTDEIFTLLLEADQLYRAALRTSPTALAYLEKRGIDDATAGRFAMGYAPAAWDTLLRRLGTSKTRIAKLIEAGLLIEKDDGRQYDRFRDRLMFPIRNARGQILGFGGRVLGDGEPKYLNSPETAVFRKGHELYGLFESRQTPGRPREMLVVEGYLDVASLVQHGIEQVVATLGTAATAENVRRLTRLTDRVIFCFDGDRAGRAAAWRALETALPFGGGTVELKFLLLPEGDDPDSFVRAHGAAAFRELAERAEPLADFFVRGLTARVDFGTVDGRARFAAFAKPLLTRLPEGLYRATVIEAMSEKLKLGSAVLEQLLGDAPPGAALGSSPSHAARPAAPERPDRPGGPRRRTAVQKVINLLLHFPGAAARIDATERLERLNQPGAALLRRAVSWTWNAMASRSSSRAATATTSTARSIPRRPRFPAMASTTTAPSETCRRAKTRARRFRCPRASRR
jgi:DNA primase